MEKGHEPSRVELKIFQLELWLEPARLGLITNTYGMYTYGMYTYGMYTYGGYTYGLYTNGKYTYGM